jgi:hypothetical protein
MTTTNARRLAKAQKVRDLAFYGVAVVRRHAKGVCHRRTKREQRDMDRSAHLGRFHTPVVY